LNSKLGGFSNLKFEVLKKNEILIFSNLDFFKKMKNLEKIREKTRVNFKPFGEGISQKLDRLHI
jgi:hypothetical protein